MWAVIFFSGVFIGTILGIFLMTLLYISKQADEWQERVEAQLKKRKNALS